MDTIEGVWNFIKQFPPTLASGLIGTIIILMCLAAVVTWVKPTIPMSIKTFVAPMVFMGVAWTFRWLFETFSLDWLSVGFCISALVGAFWALVILVRVAVNK